MFVAKASIAPLQQTAAKTLRFIEAKHNRVTCRIQLHRKSIAGQNEAPDSLHLVLSWVANPGRSGTRQNVYRVVGLKLSLSERSLCIASTLRKAVPKNISFPLVRPTLIGGFLEKVFLVGVVTFTVNAQASIKVS